MKNWEESRQWYDYVSQKNRNICSRKLLCVSLCVYLCIYIWILIISYNWVLQGCILWEWLILKRNFENSIKFVTIDKQLFVFLLLSWQVRSFSFEMKFNFVRLFIKLSVRFIPHCPADSSRFKFNDNLIQVYYLNTWIIMFLYTKSFHFKR